MSEKTNPETGPETSGEKKTTRKKTPKEESPLKSKPPKFSFNFYWIYGIILAILIGTQIFNFNGSPRQITWDAFEQTMLKPGDVERIVIVNNQVANIYIKKDRLKQDKYEKVRIKSWGSV